MHLKLTYFDFPFWRAEVSRLALHLADIPFEDVRPSRDEFLALKSSDTLPYDQLPVLEVDGVAYAQSTAIARFCGRAAGLYPVDDPVAALLVDEYLDAATEINYALYPTMRAADPAKKLAMRQALGADTIPAWLRNLEERMKRWGHSGWAAGERMTIADLAIWRVIGWLTGGLLDGIPSNLLASHPVLTAHFEKVGSLPQICKWMAQYQSS